MLSTALSIESFFFAYKYRCVNVCIDANMLMYARVLCVWELSVLFEDDKCKGAN